MRAKFTNATRKLRVILAPITLQSEGEESYMKLKEVGGKVKLVRKHRGGGGDIACGVGREGQKEGRGGGVSWQRV